MATATAMFCTAKQQDLIVKLAFELEDQNDDLVLCLEAWDAEETARFFRGLRVATASALIDRLIKAPKRAKTPVPAVLTPATDGSKLPKKGIFTVVGHTERRTLRFSVAQNGVLKGRTVISYLCGADDEQDYARFADVSEAGELRIWRRYAEAKDLIAAVRYLMNPEKAADAGKVYSLESGNCYRCGRTLTVPESIEAGIGPECAKIVGG